MSSVGSSLSFANTFVYDLFGNNQLFWRINVDMLLFSPLLEMTTAPLLSVPRY